MSENDEERFGRRGKRVKRASSGKEMWDDGEWSERGDKIGRMSRKYDCRNGWKKETRWNNNKETESERCLLKCTSRAPSTDVILPRPDSPLAVSAAEESINRERGLIRDL